MYKLGSQMHGYLFAVSMACARLEISAMNGRPFF